MIPGFSSEANTPEIFQGHTLGDRRSNFDYAAKGILTKVVYPTKGETEFIYEPAMKLYTHKGFFSTGTFTLVAEEDGSNLWSCNRVQNFTPTISQTVTVTINNYLLDDGVDTVHDRSIIKIKNLTTNQEILYENLVLGQHHFDVSFSQGNTYQISVNLCNTVKEDHMISNLSFQYTIGELPGDNYNGTGVRVFERINRSTNGLAEKQVYYYNKKEAISDKNFPQFYFRNNYKLYQNMESSCNWVQDPAEFDNSTNLNYFQTSIISSSNNLPIIYTTNSQIGYRFVTKSFGENFEGGVSEKEFQYNANAYDRWVYGQQIDNPNIDNININNGRLIEENFYKYNATNFIQVSEKKYLYNSNNISQVLRSYQGTTRFTNNSVIDPNNAVLVYINALSGKDVSAYHIDLTCNQLEQTIEKSFYNGTPIESTSTYFYENGKCNRVSRQETTYSNGETNKIKTFYSSDPLLTNQNRIYEVIKKEHFKNSVLLSTVVTDYKDWGDNIILPEKIQTSKGLNTLKDRIIYHSYDTKGNPKELSKKDGTKIYYVWGYEQTQPIAKIEGYTSINSTQLSYINQAISASNNDSSISTENTLRSKLTLLRNSFTTTNAQVTTFTYDPMIGVTSMTDPRGERIYYHYDAFNRLEYVKDAHVNRFNLCGYYGYYAKSRCRIDRNYTSRSFI
jgi:hypothetical protein